jgi:hypothetical protein
MMMTPRLRALSLTAHVGSSVGWFGAVASFLALAFVGVARQDPETVRACYVAMHLTTWFVIVPFGILGFATGVVQSLGTPWGLFRHYWIVTKLLLTTIATLLLLLHTKPIDQVAAVAMSGTLGAGDLWSLRLQMIGDASAALFALAGMTALSVYKPWGFTPYGVRQQNVIRPSIRSRSAGVSGQYVLIGIGVVLAVIVLMHLLGVGLHAH